MMKSISEVYEFNLLMNLPIFYALDNGEQIIIKTPSIKQYESELGYQMLSSIFLIDTDDLKTDPYKYGFTQTTDSYIDVLIGAKTIQDLEPGISAFEELTGTKVTLNGVYYNEKLLNDEDISFIRLVYLTSVNKVDKEEVETEAEKKLSDAEKRIERIRGKKKKKEEKRTLNFVDVALLLIYEMGMSMTEILQLNYYGFSRLGVLTDYLPMDKIIKIAAGNGKFDKEYKNITEN